MLSVQAAWPLGEGMSQPERVAAIAEQTAAAATNSVGGRQVAVQAELPNGVFSHGTWHKTRVEKLAKLSTDDRV